MLTNPRILLTLTLCLCLSFLSQAQVSLSLHKLLDKVDEGTTLPVLLRPNQNPTAPDIRTLAQYGSWYRADLTPSEIRELSANHQYFVDLPQAPLRLLNDMMIRQNNADSVHLGAGLLDTAYTGKGIVIGIIDAPFDPWHPDFNDNDGHTRIKLLWDQSMAEDGSEPATYNYGITCDSLSIADSTCPHIDYNYWYSHGSGVAGVAASGGHTPDNYMGVAPEADLVFVTLDFGSDFLTNVLDAITFVFDYADSVGKPCVINTSFGSYTGSHDGKDAITQSIEAMLNEQPGRAIVAAAGNAGDRRIHLGMDLDSASGFTWFKKLSYTNLVYWQLWADTSDLHDLGLLVGADDPDTWTFKGYTDTLYVNEDLGLSGGDIDSLSEVLVYLGDTVGNITWYGQLLDDRYLLECYIEPNDPGDYWRLAASGTGRFDLWGMEGFTGFSDMVADDLPSEAELPDIVEYRLPDTDQSIVGFWQCSENVITVGSYVNRDTMTNYYGDNPPLADTVGQLFYSSSHGPTRDGRTKPDVASTGSRVLTTGSSVLTEWLISLGAANYMSQDGQHYLQNGTSFASPAVTGIAALYLQHFPDADHNEIRYAIAGNARKDSLTGYALPDNRWGHGKADAYRALTGPWECHEWVGLIPPKSLEVLATGTHFAQLGWQEQPASDRYQIAWRSAAEPWQYRKVSDGPANIGPLLPSTTYRARIRSRCPGEGVGDWSETIEFTTLALRVADQSKFSISPNPANVQVTISGIGSGTRIRLISGTGAVVMDEWTEEGQHVLDISNLPSGIYIVECGTETGNYREQLVILE
jgi:subtilisin family serine protease